MTAPRRDAPNALHHVYCRGINRQSLFRDESDYSRYQTRVGKVLEACGAKYLAFAWMPNHTHAVHASGESALLSLAMLRINGAYAKSYNRKYERTGYVFERRFNSKLVASDAGLLALVSYVLLNPLRAGLVRSVSDLRTCARTALPALLGRMNVPFIDVDRVLRIFGDDPRCARRALLRALEADAKGEHPFGSVQVLEFDDDPTAIVGPVSEVWSSSVLAPGARTTRGWARREGAAALDVELSRICQERGVGRDELFAGRRGAHFIGARELAILHGYFQLRLPQSVIARTLKVTRSCVSRCLDRHRTRTRRVYSPSGIRAKS